MPSLDKEIGNSEFTLQMLLLLINRLHLSLASALIDHPLFGMAWFCIPYKHEQLYKEL